MIAANDKRFTLCAVRHGYNETRARVVPGSSATAWRFYAPCIAAYAIPEGALTEAERAALGTWRAVRVDGVVGYLRRAAFDAWEPLMVTVEPVTLARRRRVLLSRLQDVA